MNDDAQLDKMLTNFYAGDTPTIKFAPPPAGTAPTPTPRPGRAWLLRHKLEAAIVGVIVVALIATGAYAIATRAAGNGNVVDLMADLNVKPTSVAPVPGPTSNMDAAPLPDDALANFAVQLARQALVDGENGLVSPLSAELALAMTANGASGETLAQMLGVLGDGASLDSLNAGLSSYVANLPSTDKAKFQVANSIWYNSTADVGVKQDFLRDNAAWYDAGAYAAPFDAATLKAINDWVARSTDDLIPKMLDDLDPSQAMVLLNALVFDAAWMVPYVDDNVSPGTFTAADGSQQDAKFMNSMEYTYIDDGTVTGFIKPYDGFGYGFVALLPNQGVSVADYLASLTGAKWLGLMADAQGGAVQASMPAFSSSYTVTLNDALAAMGMPDAFMPTADFSAMADTSLHIDMVLQRTHIDVTQKGTQAGAATAVVMTGSGLIAEPMVVTLDRPFIYAIIDEATGLPLFLGVTNSLT